MMIRSRTHLLTAIILVSLTSGLPADLTSPSTDSPDSLTAAQKNGALEFAKEHHPQLHSLIRRLEKRDVVEYDRALTDVSKTCERLGRVQSRDLERYHVDLALWKADSRIRLLAARMANNEQDSLKDQLRSLLNERMDLRLQQLALERKRLTVRIEKLNDQIAQQSSDRPAQVEKEVERLQKSVRNQTMSSRRQKPKDADLKSPPTQPSNRSGQDVPTSSPAPAQKSKSNPRT